ncbi:50S ribosomal protein L23 [Patescibacteria group bacterium]|nr:50S ribosomal protein L23 [Patescibacteria group bacterium]
MGLFTRTKKAEAPKAAAKVSNKGAGPLATDRDLRGVIIRPRVTEKAVSKSDQNVYTFLIRQGATKFDVRDAIKELYKVTPEKIRTVTKAPAVRPSGSRNRMVKVAGMKKAYVYLKKGDTINLV